MRKIYLALCLLITGLLFASKGYSQFSVTATAGTTGPTLYTTLYDVVTAINAGTHQGAINVSITASSNETLPSSLNSSGTGSASYTRVYITSPGTATHSIVGAFNNQAILKLNGADNVTISGSVGPLATNLNFQNFGTNGTAIWFASASPTDGATHDSVANMVVYGTLADVFSGNGATIGTSATAPNNNNTIIGCTSLGNGYMIMGFSSAPYDNAWNISGNIGQPYVTKSIYLSNGTNATITYNFIGVNIGGSSTLTSDTLAGIDIEGNCSGLDMWNNYITGVVQTRTNGGACGILLNASTASTNMKIYNNQIYGIRSVNASSTLAGAGSSGNGIVIAGGAGYNIWFNSINMNVNQTSGFATAGINILSTVTTPGAIDLRDNLIVNSQTSGATTRAAVYCQAASNVFSSIDYNDYYSASSVLGFIGGSNRTTIAQMQSGFGGNINSISVNPVFSGSMLKLSQVVANEPLQSGIAISGITQDYEYNLRAAVPVMGASEVHLPLISYTALASTCNNTDIVLSGVSIADYYGVPTTGTLVPRIYFRKNSGAWSSMPGTMTAGSATSGTWSFTIPLSSLGGSLATGDIVNYYVIAQSINAAGNIASFPYAGLVATDVNTVTTPPTAPSTLTVGTAPLAITGPHTVCTGYNITLSNASPGATNNWTSSTPSVASVNATTGVVTGATAGTATITYTLGSSGCYTTYSVTSNLTPSAISGSLSLCNGNSTTLTSSPTGGTWFSSNTAVANIGAGTGFVTTGSVGNSNITYTTTATGCYSTSVFTVTATPSASAVQPNICTNSSYTFTNGTPGGTWSMDNYVVGAITPTTGVITTGLSSGTTHITYTAPNGCYTVSITTVNQLPADIGGTSLSVCQGGSATATDATSGGLWSTTSPAAITIGSTSGIYSSTGAAGNYNILYTITSTGCAKTAQVTVNPSPAPIVGTLLLCTGNSTTLTSATPGGGVWSSNAPSVASIDFNFGTVYAATAGNATITYTRYITNCTSTAVITVNPTPSAIGGNPSICLGTSNTLTNTLSGGVWTSSNTTVAPINSSTGVVSGSAVGTSIISYVANGCPGTSIVVTVSIPPAPITGPTAVCVNSSINLTSTTGIGTWTSANTAIATVGGVSGAVTGVAAGVTNISYTTAGGCAVGYTITVNPLPSIITGPTNVCIGDAIDLYTTSTSGNWSSGNLTLATINTNPDGSGHVAGVGAGTVPISYTFTSTGCARIAMVTVNALPTIISGPSAVCVGSNISLASGGGTGTWSSNLPTTATVTINGGVVTGVTAGNATISYILTTGCYRTTNVTVNQVPTPIGGTLTVCTGSTTTLSSTSTPPEVGIWSTTSSAIATVGPTSGIVSGVAAGNTSVVYTLSSGCSASAIVTVSTTPPAITGNLAVCLGLTTTLSNTQAGGTWTSNDPATIATISASGGVVNAIGAGTTVITYHSAGTICYATAVVTVNPLPLAITGIAEVCAGSATTLADATSGGTWSTSNANASAGASSGVITGLIAGNSTITYQLPTGCISTRIATIDPAPAAISGTASICAGTTTLLSDVTTGGTWISSLPSVATIDATGMVTASATTTGTTTISYILSATGCFNTRVVTVNALPGAIGGVQTVCVGLTTTLTNSVSGGTWSSGNPSIATVTPSTGVVTGGSAGNATITYLASTGCQSTTVVTVLALPATISGASTTCIGLTTTLSSTPTGGTWSSSNIVTATVDPSTGVVTGANAGTTTISYQSPNGCFTTKIVTVQTLPTLIGGIPAVCSGQTTALSSSPTGGIWTSNDAAVASVSTTGVVTGGSVAAPSATTTITYTLGTGCYRTIQITVNATPANITGNTVLCVGATSTLSSATAGGTWVSGNPALAAVGYNTGIVSAYIAGTLNITYTLTTGCSTFISATVNPLPASIAGTTAVCSGNTTTLTDATPGGTWSSSDPAIASIGFGSGILVGGATSGTATITYTLLPTGCLATRLVTVNPLPAAITGPTSLCVGLTTTLSSPTLGGTWSSSTTGIATVATGTGVVTGVSNGTATITYTLATGCLVTQIVTVNPLPDVITGNASVCAGGTTVLSNSTPGGTWSSSNTVIGTVNATTGVVSGMSPGNAVITYTIGTSCQVFRSITVNPTPSSIIGSLVVCQGLTTSLSDLTPGGTWSSSNTVVATVNSATGMVSALQGGNTTIVYTLGSTTCSASAIITVNPLPDAINGTTNICIGLSTTLTSTSTPGSWSSSNTLVANIGSSTGILNGVATGTARITYTLNTGCKINTVITVSPVPADIGGITTICQGGSTTLNDITPAGNWNTADFAIASVSTTGLVEGVSPGVAVITYTLATGCYKSVNVTVNLTPGANTGSTSLCASGSTTLSNATVGGNWTSSTPTVATIDISSGLVNAVNAGTTTITYSMPTGCRATTTVTVSPLPTTITGTTLLCSGSTTTLHNTIPGGTWSSSNPAAAIIDALSGEVTGTTSVASTQTSVINYTIGAGCTTAIVVTVTAAPPAIVGDTSLCQGSISHLSNSSSGGTWSSSNTTVATVTVGDGYVTGHAQGTAYVTYTLGAGCYVVAPVTVNQSPAAITGPNNVCVGSSITLNETVPGGTWISDDVSVATVGATTGVVAGINGNIDTIRYLLPGGCYAKFGVTVNALPAPIDNQPLQVCQGLIATLTDAPLGGIWTSSDPAVAAITPTPSSNTILGVSAGTVTVSYILTSTGCATSATLTVNPSPDPITGNTTVCESSTTLLSTTSTAGTWSSSNVSRALIGSGSGIVTGISAGIATVTYTLPTTCITTVLVVVNPSPAAITGPTDICVASSAVMANATPFGLWTSSNTAVASIGSTSGEITGVSAGTATVTYALGTTGCYVTKQVTINPLPPPVLGNPFLCIGSVTFLTNVAAPGGAWSTANASIATVDGFGNVSGISAGTTIITYTLSTACYVSTLVTVEPIPGTITGTVTNLCVSSQVTLSDAYFGGVWTSSNSAVATVGTTTGVVTGVSAGPVTITYSTPLAHCFATTTVTIDPLPVAIVGIDSVCEATTATYFDGTTGGTWSTSSSATATINSTSGVLTGVSPNTVTISYTIGNGCSATKVVTINPSAHAGTIVGASNVCVGTTISLTNPTASPVGTWSSSNTTAATIDPLTGIVSGIAEGTAVITYIATNNCTSDTTTLPITISPQPDGGTISGILSLCKDYTSTLSSTTPGGVWTSGNTGVATVSATGVVTAVASGTATISYAVTNLCGTDTKTVIVTVNLVAPHTAIVIHPDSAMCLNTLYQNFGIDSAQPAGFLYTWSAVNAEVYAVSASKQNSLVSFHTPGTAYVILTTQITNTGCFVTDTFTTTIGVDSTPTPTIQYYGAELVCTDNIADSYAWGYDDVVTLDSTVMLGMGFNQQAYYLPVPDFTNKKYFVITKHGDCMQKTYYNVPTNVGPNLGANIDIRMFPNPADARLNIEVTGVNLSDDITIRVIDMLGKEIEASGLVNGKGSINVSNMAAGVYSVMFISNGEKIGARTFVKK